MNMIDKISAFGLVVLLASSACASDGGGQSESSTGLVPTVTTMTLPSNAPVQPATHYQYYYPYYYAYYYAAPPLLCQRYGQAPAAYYYYPAMRPYVVYTASGQSPYSQSAPVSCEAALQQVAAYAPHSQAVHSDAAQDSEVAPAAQDEPVRIPDSDCLKVPLWQKMGERAWRSGLLNMAGHTMRPSEVRQEVGEILARYENSWPEAMSMKEGVVNILLKTRSVPDELTRKRKRPMKSYE